MAKQDVVKVFCFDTEIGALGWDANRGVSFFQFHPEFLANNPYPNLLPPTRMIRRVKEVQVFKKYNSGSFRGLPPIFADSLPDLFGNIVFKSWLESKNKNLNKISVIEQLAYVADRGMGAFEYKPKKAIPNATGINIDEIIEVLQQVMDLKAKTAAKELNHEALLNIFKIGTSAGGARPKILISESKLDGSIVPGDIHFSEDYEHYLVKLNLDDEGHYNPEMMEFAYYLTAKHCGISMMDSKLIDNRHFATKRFDRMAGEKIHVLTASGITGWDFKDPSNASYENLFELAIFLKVPHAQIEELFRRMVFNLVFANNDDHLKNHSFTYDRHNDRWNLSPAYDLTYSLNPLVNFKKTSRALSINHKRVHIGLEDIKQIAKKYTVRNYMAIIEEVQSGMVFWQHCTKDLGIPLKIRERIASDFVVLR